MATPANYATLIAEIDAIVDDYALTLFEVSGGKPSNLLSLMQLIDLRYKLFEAGGSGGAGTVVLAVFKAIGAGTGYSIDDIIILRQTPPAAAEWFNATTGSVIATPDPADLGSVGAAGDASASNQLTQITRAELTNTRLGDLAETAPASDTASSGLNGRLQRIAQRITSLIALLPSSLGAKTAANSLAVTLATDGVASGIDAKIGEVQASPTANTVLARLKAIADALVFGIKTAANSISIAPASDAVFNVREQATPFYVFTAIIQRAANTTAYTANDTYGAAFELVGGTTPPSGVSLIITDIDIIFNLTALPSGMGGFTFYPYSVTPPSAVADNGAFSVPSGDRASILYPRGISVGSAVLAQGGGSVVAQANSANVSLRLTGTSFFGYLVTTAAFTPAANSETATIRVRAIAL